MTSQLVDALKNPKLPIAELNRMIHELDQSADFSREVRIGVSANITSEPFGNAFKKHAYLEGIRARITHGSYNAHLDNLKVYAKENYDAVLMIHFFDNLLPSLESRLGQFDQKFLDQLKNQFRNELHLALMEAQSIKSVYLTLFHRYGLPQASQARDLVDDILDSFNEILQEEAKLHSQVKVIPTERIVSKLGWVHSFNPRFYYAYKAPYSSQFWDELARQVFLQSRGMGSYYYKALILDCDNTLWGGIIGEDSLNGIKLSPHDYPGNIYWSIQNQILELQKQGVLICLCSKNNLADVDEVLNQHPHQVLKNESILLKKINWESKVDNLQALAKELNLGLSSFVFVDDSPFECQAVQSQLPMVRVFQVPKNTFEYPALFDEIKALFLSGGMTEESREKTEQYRKLAQAASQREKFTNQEDYLKSLGLEIDFRLNPSANIPRISELTQKSNQFNLTTRRYTESEIKALMDSPDASVYSIHVRDIFGDHGLTGVVIVQYQNEELRILNFLMSCRVIGRGIEYAFWNHIFEDALRRGCKWVQAEYLPSEKNAQVESFYDQLGLPLTHQAEAQRTYRSPIQSVQLKTQTHVKVNYDSSQSI